MSGNRIAPDHITELKDNQIFVFGSNLSGRHGMGAAKQAMTWGAKYRIGQGLQGRTYAIPTKGKYVTTSLALSEIKKQIDEFINDAWWHPELDFLVTKIGCGLAGYTPEQIAPFFKEALAMENVYLPKIFIEILKA